MGVELTKRPVGRATVGLLLGAAVAGSAAASGVDPQLSAIAHEARQAIAVIDSFYARHHACPQPSLPAELAELQSELGDGYSAEPKGQFVVIGGISMAVVWLYYTSPQHPDKCTLWRKLSWDPALIWQRHREGAKWVFDPGDGSEQRTIKLGP
jgi:hypothetical protein